VKRLSNTV